MLQHIHEHSGPTCHICHPMPPPASNTSKAGLPEIGLRLQGGRQKQPPIAFPHLHSIRRPSESPSPASRSDAQAAAPLLPQGSIGVTGPNGQGSLLHGGRRQGQPNTVGSGRKTATCKVPAAEECRELRTAEVQLFGDFFACTILTSSCENKKPWVLPGLAAG